MPWNSLIWKQVIAGASIEARANLVKMQVFKKWRNTKVVRNIVFSRKFQESFNNGILLQRLQRMLREVGNRGQFFYIFQ